MSKKYILAVLLAIFCSSAALTADLSRIGPVTQIAGNEWFRPSTTEELKGTLSNQSLHGFVVQIGVVWQTGDVDASLCVKDHDKEYALEVYEGQSEISSISMDGIVRAKGDDVRNLTMVLYGVMQNQFASQYCGHMSKATPAVQDLK